MVIIHLFVVLGLGNRSTLINLKSAFITYQHSDLDYH
jgi:hypothetical protein